MQRGNTKTSCASLEWLVHFWGGWFAFSFVILAAIAKKQELKVYGACGTELRFPPEQISDVLREPGDVFCLLFALYMLWNMRLPASSLLVWSSLLCRMESLGGKSKIFRTWLCSTTKRQFSRQLMGIRIVTWVTCCWWSPGMNSLVHLEKQLGCKTADEWKHFPHSCL